MVTTQLVPPRPAQPRFVKIVQQGLSPRCPSVPLPRQTIHSGTFNKIKIAEHISLTLLNEHDSGTGHQYWLAEDKNQKDHQGRVMCHK